MPPSNSHFIMLMTKWASVQLYGGLKVHFKHIFYECSMSMLTFNKMLIKWKKTITVHFSSSPLKNEDIGRCFFF